MGLKPVVCLLAAWAVCAPAHAIQDWLPVTPEELQMKSEPKAPEAPAVFLYRQVDRDDTASSESVYARIKILTEEGRKYGNVEIPYYKNEQGIYQIAARTIRTDGSIVEFDGEVYEKPVVSARDRKLFAKWFTLPNVEVGTIVEYRFRRALPQGYVFDSRWLLSDDLFTRHAKFSLKPYGSFTLRWTWPMGLPEGTEAPKKQGNVIRLETHNVPAFVTEEYMPPPQAMMYRVEFVYDSGNITPSNLDAYWRGVGKDRHRRISRFIDDRSAMQKAVAEIVQPDDSPETKVRKIYARVLQLRNISFERGRSEQELKREKLKDAGSVADVWQRGYGDGFDITWLFLALVRAAGIQADPVLIPTRDEHFFHPNLMNASQLNSNGVAVTLDGRDLLLDPGTPFTPFGLLPWSATAVTSLRLNKDGGTWMDTPVSRASASRTERKADLKLSAEGSLQGKVVVTYTGHEAAWLRMALRFDDEAAKREYVEDRLKHDIPAGIQVKLVNSPDWTGSDAPLVVEYDLKVPGWVTGAGRRALFPVGLFSGPQKNMFERSQRVHPVYFRFPYQLSDDVTVELPTGWQVSSLPKARSRDLKTISYTMSAEDRKTSLHLKRRLTSEIMIVKAEQYPTVRDFFQTVRAGDEDQVVLGPAAPDSRR